MTTENSINRFELRITTKDDCLLISRYDVSENGKLGPETELDDELSIRLTFIHQEFIPAK